MFKNYLKITLRNIRRQPVYSAINIVGLGVGMACCLLILIFVKNEYSINRGFDGADHIYRINSVWHEEGDAVRLVSFSPLAETLEKDYAGVEQSFRYTAIDADLRVGTTPYRSAVIIAGPEMFEMFSFRFIAGDPQTALQNPESVVLTRAEAIKLFNSTHVLGETVLFSTWGGGGDKAFRVTGVIEDPPFNSMTYIGQQENRVFVSFHNVVDFFGDVGFDTNWGIYNTVTYVQLDKRANPDELEALLPALLESNLPDGLKGSVSLKLESLADVYLNDFGGAAGRLTRLLLFLAILIMGIACFNYINVSTALAVSRAREVGMRKVLGASQMQLVQQYLGESIVVCGLGMLIALLLAWFGIEPFGGLVERVLAFDFTAPGFWLIVVGLIAVIGVVGGIYPAFYLAAGQPSRSLTSLGSTGKKASGVRKGLVVVQFTIAIGLFISAFVINRQASHIAQQDVGFDKNQVLVVSSLPREWTPAGVEKLDVIKQAVQSIPGINHVSIAWGPPGPRYTGLTWRFEPEGDVSDGLPIPVTNVDADFLETMDIPLAAGVFFDPLQPDHESTVVLNETAVRQLNLDEPIGEYVRVDSTTYRVLGVVKDYHTVGLEQAIGPLALVDIRQVTLYREMLVRLPVSDAAQYLESVQQKWSDVYPNVAFDYYFLDQQWYDLHKWIWRTKTIAGFATVLAIFIACLGLFGVVAITVGQRTREIGVRKVIGASIPALLQLLSVGFFKLIIVAFLLAAPLAYFAMRAWLDGFANRIEISAGIFIGAGLLMLFIAGVTVFTQALRAALMNPVKSLRHE